MQKIIIIGSGGSGKSTLARTLGAKIGLPVYHLDSLFWKSNWLPTPDDEWRETVIELVKKDTWIMDGNYGKTMDIRLNEADTVIFLDLPRRTTIYRIVKRRLQYHKKTRPDMSNGCTEKLDLEFISWVWNFRKRSRKGIMQKLLDFGNKKNVIILRSPREVRQFINSI